MNVKCNVTKPALRLEGKMSDLSKRMLDGEICNPHFCKDMSERGDCLCVMSGNRIAELEAILGQLLDAHSPTLEVVKRIGRAALGEEK